MTSMCEHCGASVEEDAECDSTECLIASYDPMPPLRFAKPLSPMPLLGVRDYSSVGAKTLIVTTIPGGVFKEKP